MIPLSKIDFPAFLNPASESCRMVSETPLWEGHENLGRSPKFDPCLGLPKP